MNISQIETNLKKLITSFSKESFIYDLLLAYGLPKASITRLKKGNLNLSKVAGEVSWKKKLLFKEEYEEDLHLAILSLRNALKRSKPFASDEERLAYLFKLYEKMIQEEKDKGTLFAKANLPAGKAGKTRRKSKP